MTPSAPLKHTRQEDFLAVVTGTLLIGLGVLMFQRVGMVAGGTVALAFIVHYLTGRAFGPTLFAINVPFYVLAWRQMGVPFTLRSAATVGLLHW